MERVMLVTGDVRVMNIFIRCLLFKVARNTLHFVFANVVAGKATIKNEEAFAAYRIRKFIHRL